MDVDKALSQEDSKIRAALEAARKGRSIREIERVLGLSNGTLQKFMKGERSLSRKAMAAIRPLIEKEGVG